MAVANSLAAVQAGARQVECTINGIGERAGNASLEEIVMALEVRADALPHRTGIHTPALVPTSNALSAIVGVAVPPNKAIVGANAFAHEAGIHQDGMLKYELTYEIMRPESVGAAGTRLVLGKHSGLRGLDARCRALGHRLRQPELERLYTKVTALADKTKTVNDDQLAAIIREEVAALAVARGGRRGPWRAGMPLKIALLPGDGIGPEVTEEAVRILKNVGEHSGKTFTFSTHPIGGAAIDAEGVGLPEHTLEACLGAKAVLLGAVGHPKFDGRCLLNVLKRRCWRYASRSAALPTCGPRSVIPRSRSALRFNRNV